MSVRVLFCAVGADAGDGDAAVFDLRAGLLFDLGKGIRRKLQPVDVADRPQMRQMKCAWGSVRKSKRSSPL